MRVATVVNDRLYAEAIAAILRQDGKTYVISSSTDVSSVLASAGGIDLLIIDTRDLNARDMGYLLGAKAYGEFSVVALAEENEVDATAFDRVVSRASSASDLAQAISAFAPKTRGRRPSANPWHLGAREYEVATLVSRGYNNRRISELTGLKEQSIKNMVSTVMRKMSCDNRTQIALMLTSSAADEKLASALR